MHWLHTFWQETKYVLSFTVQHIEIWSSLAIYILFRVAMSQRKRRKQKEQELANAPPKQPQTQIKDQPIPDEVTDYDF